VSTETSTFIRSGSSKGCAWGIFRELIPRGSGIGDTTSLCPCWPTLAPYGGNGGFFWLGNVFCL